jgi:hypothetical protein
MNNNSLNDQLLADTTFPVVFVIETEDSEAINRTRLAWYGLKEKPLSKVGKHLDEMFPEILAFYEGYRTPRFPPPRDYHYLEFQNEESARSALLAARLSNSCLHSAFRFTKSDRRQIKNAYRRLHELNLVQHSLASLDCTVIDYIQFMQRYRPKSDIYLSYAFVEAADFNAQMEARLIHDELEGFIPDMLIWSRSEESFC